MANPKVNDQRTPTPKRRVPLGTIEPLSEEEIAALAEVTPEEIEELKAELVPELRELLDAQPEGER